MVRFVQLKNDDPRYVCMDGIGDEECLTRAVVALVEDNGAWCGQAACANERHLAHAIELHETRKADEWAWHKYLAWVEVP